MTADDRRESERNIRVLKKEIEEFTDSHEPEDGVMMDKIKELRRLRRLR